MGIITSSDYERSSTPPGDGAILGRAVVYDTLSNLSLRDQKTIDEIKSNISNDDDFDIAPRNSILIKHISASRGRSENKVSVCFPFFSSHIAFPIKAGEQVWVIWETPENKAPRCYWLSRIHEPVSVEDVNYTHGDRRNIGSDKENIVSIDDDDNVIGYTKEDLVPFFINGKNPSMDVEDQLTLTPPDEFERIYKETKEHNSFVIEPIPRFTKRPGDLVLQGSHNATIVLGSARGYTAKDKLDREKTNAHPEEKLPHGNGSIDIIVGRGRIFAGLDNLDGKDKRDKIPSRTEPRVIKTTLGPKGEGDNPRQKDAREVFETDKHIELADMKKFSNTKTDACEGDPDFVNDASRLYLTLQSTPDDDFLLTYPQVPKPKDAKNEPKDIGVPMNQAAIVAKSDHIRIIARQTGLPDQKDAEMSGDNEDAIETQGSINIIKEGIPDDEAGKGRAVIMLNSDGVIMIDGPKIVLGSGIVKGNGEGVQVALGLGATEPIVLGDILKTKLEAYMDAVSAAFQYASTHVHPTGTGPSGPPTGEQWSAKKGDIDTTKGELSEILSKLAKTL